VEGLTKAVALEFAKQGIRVNSIAPGSIDTDMVDRLVGKEGDQRNYRCRKEWPPDPRSFDLHRNEGRKACIIWAGGC
jgi:NAD(P)-dependent dehydrogenase (short-subunit alcohol dehydrogenase family)